MSTPPPPDRPTQPLPPARHVPLVDERVVAPAVDLNVVLLRLEDAVVSLRNWILVVGVIALAALGVALYALLRDDSGTRGSSRRGLASSERVSRLDGRVDRLSRQVQGVRAGGRGDAVLADRVDGLERRIKTLADQPSGGDSTQAIEQLSSRVDALARDVDALKKSTP